MAIERGLNQEKKHSRTHLPSIQPVTFWQVASHDSGGIKAERLGRQLRNTGVSHVTARRFKCS